MPHPSGYHFEATQDNWKPSYTQVLYWVQKNLPDEEIAAKVELAPNTIAKIRLSPYFRERLQAAQETYEHRRSERLADLQMTDPTQRKLDAAAKTAASILVKALRGKGDVSRQQIFVAKDILDRTGYKAKEKIELETYSHNYTPQEIESAQATLIEVQEILSSIGVSGNPYLISKSRESYSTPSHSTATLPSSEERCEVQNAETTL